MYLGRKKSGKRLTSMNEDKIHESMFCAASRLAKTKLSICHKSTWVLSIQFSSTKQLFNNCNYIYSINVYEKVWLSKNYQVCSKMLKPEKQIKVKCPKCLVQRAFHLISLHSWNFFGSKIAKGEPRFMFLSYWIVCKVLTIAQSRSAK